jgi:hypothetical protein
VLVGVLFALRHAWAPCILHRPFFIAGDWQGFSLRVLAAATDALIPPSLI